MIHLICGHTGAGKSTYAKKLAAQKGAVIFCIDEWMKTLFLPDQKGAMELDWMLQRIDRCELIIWSLSQQIVQLKTDVIFDLGLSKVSHREKFRQLAAQHHIDVLLHYVTADKQTRLQRVLSRNASRSETYAFDVTPGMFEFMESWVEEPSADELKGAVIISS